MSHVDRELTEDHPGTVAAAGSRTFTTGSRRRSRPLGRDLAGELAGRPIRLRRVAGLAARRPDPRTPGAGGRGTGRLRGVRPAPARVRTCAAGSIGGGGIEGWS